MGPHKYGNLSLFGFEGVPLFHGISWLFWIRQKSRAAV
jgi:hypothetical protein